MAPVEHTWPQALQPKLQYQAAAPAAASTRLHPPEARLKPLGGAHTLHACATMHSPLKSVSARLGRRIIVAGWRRVIGSTPAQSHPAADAPSAANNWRRVGS
jgi:hypothetical protein